MNEKNTHVFFPVSASSLQYAILSDLRNYKKACVYKINY